VPCQPVDAAVTVRLIGTTYVATPETVPAGCVSVTLIGPGTALVIDDVPGLIVTGGESRAACLTRGRHAMYAPIPGHRAQGLETAIRVARNPQSTCGG